MEIFNRSMFTTPLLSFQSEIGVVVASFNSDSTFIKAIEVGANAGRSSSTVILLVFMDGLRCH